MKLNAFIIEERLRRKYPVKMYGEASPKLLLGPPELYMDNTLRFFSNHVYLATVEHLPQRPVIEKNVVLVCIGDSPRLSYYKEHAAVILIKKKVDFFQVYKSLQDIYGLFYTWEGRLLELFMSSPTVQDILTCSYPVFESPVFVLDTAFQYVASVCPSEKKLGNINWSPSQRALDSESFLQFLREKDMSMDTHGPLLLELKGVLALCVNLFNSNDDYIGCLYIDKTDCAYIQGEDKLAEYLAHMIEKVFEGIPVLVKNEHGSLKKILQLTMSELPLSQNQKMLLKSSNYKQNYICTSFHCLKHFSALPVRYLCSVLESMLTDSIFFEQDNTILGLVPLKAFREEALAIQELREKTAALVEEMQLCAGVSNVFTDLYLLRTYYLQAESAIENGQLYTPGQRLYCFFEFALLEMVSNSFGGFPVEAYFPGGFRKLLEHDVGGEISYLETLSVFLEENMSYARAARRLFIHRSTLIERISRINNELAVNLEDPDQRLQLQIILKALSIEKRLKEQ